MSNATHTPTPWFLEGNWKPGSRKIGGWLSSFPPSGVPVFELTPVVGADDEICANAAFIVRAVNSHDKLVEALTAARAQLAFWKATADAVDGKANSMPFIEPSSYALAEIDAALASLQSQETGDSSDAA